MAERTSSRERSLPRAIAPTSSSNLRSRRRSACSRDSLEKSLRTKGSPADLYGETATTSASTPIRFRASLRKLTLVRSPVTPMVASGVTTISSAAQAR
jgi:hypothetical protein